ncbi:MAG: DUF2335 domain-containing protein [Magnetospirillum sp. WYHS-4]
MKTAPERSHPSKTEAEANDSAMGNLLMDPAIPGDLESKIEEALEPIVGKEKSELVLKRVEAVLGAELFSGPLPPPTYLRAYEDIQPGLADRIVTMAEFEQQERNHRATARLNAEIRSHGQGVIMGFAIAITLIGGAIFLAMHNQVIVACSLVGAAAVAMVPSFVGSVRHLHKKEATAPSPSPVPPQGQSRKRRSNRKK